ncbi:alpha/beta fold hydrolase [Ruegeria litorea]|uniref:Alpha/beta fold hydrolase n=1 Tax=Falsiruegeria litorea TaxID=1280831 RepID=A0ABS5WLR9_9RHOB|nr:alpha/beta fold hydrolase [Falsiruegeria litorea]MBT3139498.1 alpha/beta fold hydrolase [Falsiruegeria litorea]
MRKDHLDAVETMFRQAMETHPVFSGLDMDQLQTLSKDFFRSFEAFSSGEDHPLAAWTSSWLKYQNDLAQVWMSSLVPGSDPVAASKDRRFQSEGWNEGVFPLLRQSYELTVKAMTDAADNAGLPEHEQNKLSFYARVAADNMAPSNFAVTNPDVLKLAKETGGQSLIDGFQNLLSDLEKGYITTTDEDAFEVGKNLATTPGQVVFRNDLIELIQYEPMTAKVRGNPILIVPPCVNKFYIFDLNEKKSMIRHMLEQGQSVFTISWRNPGPDQGDNGWDEYIRDGVFEALKATSAISKSENVDMLGWCNGGTMLIAALAVIPEDLKALVGSATFLSSMIDFSDPGQVKVFMDDQQNAAYNLRLQSEKVAPGRDIANAMAMLHVNDSIWNFVISNYLMGKTPAPFDVLYWNSDTSNLPAKWYSYYIEEMYMANRLKEPGALTLLETPVDTQNIDVPCYFVAADGDHIVPWRGSYTATSLVSGPTEFVLTTGGHVSGTVINHPTRNRKRFWTAGETTGDADAWQASAAVSDGSWWPHWLEWLQKSNPAQQITKPRSLGNKSYKALAAAPGTYVVENA